MSQGTDHVDLVLRGLIRYAGGVEATQGRGTGGEQAFNTERAAITYASWGGGG